jgi:hypothetical protein
MSKNKNASRMNSRPPHSPAETRREEDWKMSPSTEVTGDKGDNAAKAARRKIAENTPRRPAAKPGPHRRTP